MRTSLRTLVGLSAALVLAGTVGTASADHTAWTSSSDGNSSASGGVVTLVNAEGDPDGTSWENTHVGVPIANNDTITFEWRSPEGEVNCGGGAPRVFVRGGAYNTFNGNPDQCGTDSDGDGWSTVTGTISGVTAGEAGHVGIVNDNPSDKGTIQVRNLVIAGVNVTGPASADGCKNGGWEGFHKNQGACVSSFAKSK